MKFTEEQRSLIRTEEVHIAALGRLEGFLMGMLATIPELDNNRLLRDEIRRMLNTTRCAVIRAVSNINKEQTQERGAKP